MSTRIEHLMKALRDLPYEDMVEVATVLSRKLGDSRHSEVYRYADALSGLRAEFVNTTQIDEQEEKALREMVGSRRSGFELKIRKLPKGWTAGCDSFRASYATAPTARDAITQYLDQAIVGHMMLK